MAFIANFLTEKLQAKIAEKLVDETTFRRIQRSGILEKYLPIQTFNTADFVYYITETISPIATVRAMGGPVPTTGYGGFNKMTVDALNIAKGYIFDTRMQDQMQKIMTEALYKGVDVVSGVDPSTGRFESLNDALVNYLFGTVKGIVDGIMDKYLQMGWEVLSYGSTSTSSDPLTKVSYNLNFRQQNEPWDALLFPADLTDTGNTTTPYLNKWTDYVNADGIETMQQLVLNYTELNGYRPDAVAMSQRSVIHLRNQQSTIVRARQAAGLAQVGSVGIDMLQNILALNELPPIVQVNELYDVESTLPQESTYTYSPFVTRARFLPENRIVFLKEGAGSIAMGSTVEMKNVKEDDGRVSNENSSIMVRVYEKSKIPMVDEMYGLSYGCPIVASPRRLMAQTVW